MYSILTTRKFVVRFLLLTMAAFLVAVSPVKAQVLYGTLTGNVTDSTGAVVTSASVTATNTGTGAIRTVTVNGDGLYTIENLQPGTYTVSVTANGFAQFKASEVQLSPKIDPHDLTIQLFQNGQLRQNSNTSQLIFNCYQLVSFISTNMTLLPGDVIVTGTPSGVGPIQSGDRLEVRIQGMAPLVNTVK